MKLKSKSQLPAQNSRLTSTHTTSAEPRPTSALAFAKDGAPSSPCPNAVSISDMDVRALKIFYSNDATPSSSTPRSQYSPLADGTSAIFSVEAIALCVKTLIADDRALMERLI